MRGALPWLRELLLGGGRPRCTLLATAIGMVVLGVVGMHQLSSGHDLVTPSVGAHQHVSAHPSMGVQRTWPGQPPNVGTIAAGIQPHTSSGGSLGEDCPGCGGHSLALGACLLALTLLVLSWCLAPPRVRHLPPRMLWHPGTVLTLLGRWLPALSLAQLSLLRT
jgi:hypothetical protein